ncbi:hypothetical protein L6R52_38175, partial [Myxococcota bacterium]|nr:hypothetical protein [Myxococcota bacterium]
ALGGAGAGGIAGARANLPGAATVVDPAQPQQPLASGVVGATKDGAEKKSATINNEISETRSRSIGPKVRLGRLHVAVLVDAASLEPTPVAVAPVPTTTIAATGTSTPTPVPAKTSSSTLLAGLTTKDLPSIHALVGTAAGIDLARGDRIEVRSIPFASSRETAAPVATAPSPIEELLREPKVLAIGAGALAAITVLAVLVAIVARRRKKQHEEAKTPELVATQVLPLTAAQMESALEGKLIESPAAPPIPLPPQTPRDRAIEAVRTDTARAARVLAAWLAQPVQEPVRAGEEK